MSGPASAGGAPPLYASTRSVGGGEVAISVARVEGGVEAVFDASAVGGDGLVLHWAVTKEGGGAWVAPPEGAVTAEGGSEGFGDGIAGRARFVDGVVKFFVVEDVLGGVCGGGGGAGGESESEEEEEGEEDGEKEVVLGSVVGILVGSGGGDDDWMHAADGKGDLVAAFKGEGSGAGGGGKVGAELAKRAAKEEGGGDMNLYRRYCLVAGCVSEAAGDPSGAGMGVLLAWLRMSASRLLPWYAGGNYQGKDMAHIQKVLAGDMAAVSAKGGITGHLARLALAVLPRGGGDGDAIRMGILHLMRANGIKEGHRPGIEDPFIGQWHQKLHSNTTKDDIAIGEAHLHFLQGSGDWGDFWSYLWDNYKLSKEDLAGMKAGWRTSGISGPALHMPQLIPAFKHLLWIIKIAHSGADMDTAAAMGRGGMPDDLQWDVDDLLKNRDAWWVPGKIVNVRQRLEGCWRNPESRDPGTNRNIVLLDIALESFFRTKVEGVDLSSMSRDDRANLLEIALSGGVIAAGSDELSAALLNWKRLIGGDCGMEKWSKDWALAADAALENIALAVACVLDSIGKFVQAPANLIGKAVKTDKMHLLNFGEEVVRGHALFPISAMLASLQPEVREIAGLSPWQLISHGSALVAGKVVVRNLSDMQGETASSKKTGTVVLSEELGGLEDVPPGVVAVLTKTPVDLLSHIAIRARNTGVMLASCADQSMWDAFTSKEGELCKLSVDATSGAVVAAEATAAEATMPGSSSQSGDEAKVELVKPASLKAWTLLPAEYSPDTVGGKAMSLSKLGAQTAALGDGVSVPPSFAVPFGSFERALSADSEADAAMNAALTALTASDSKDAKAVRKALRAVQRIVRNVAIPKELTKSVSEAGSAFKDIENCWDAVKGVWASKWTERAYLSRRACGLAESDLFMGVLCMNIVPAEYAFVLHTVDPVSGDKDSVFGEVVVGLGETLVGNSPGRALSFSASKTGNSVQIHSLPSKLHGHFAPKGGTLIARSDSNGEDLEGFAGAGLYDSVCAQSPHVRAVSYANEPLMWDSNFREGLVNKLVVVAKAVEDLIGSAQDIEGCIVGDEVYLVQARAQI